MEDKYLFRGKRIDNHHWITGNLCVTSAFTYICEFLEDNMAGCFTSTFTKVNPDTVGQCTSIRDKDGTLIFEGDIVRSDDGMIYKMRYHERAYCITADIEGTCSRFENLWNLDPEKIEIIGSVFDKPEYFGDL